MKTVVITGSARGFGFQMIKLFREAELMLFYVIYLKKL